jgi:hypothetical protein
MATATATVDILQPGTAVVSKASMRGVPSGTEGKVIHVQGLAWTRYWVLFDNGVRMGTLDRSRIATPEEWQKILSGPDPEEAKALVLAEAGAAAPSAVAGAAPELASVGGVPGHLLERSRKARERWAAKSAG